MTAKPPVVAVINSSEETVQAIRDVLEAAGYNTSGAHVDEFRKGKKDLLAYVEQHQPDVIVYDVSPPYEENWHFLNLCRAAVKGPKFVISTTNKRALDSLVGETEAIEIIGKPFDLEQILGAVQRALE
jgi:CheY-like chemotaxis protein